MLQVFSLFPDLFFLSPFAATILRLSAAYALIYIANSLIRDRSKIMQARVPIIGHMDGWMVWLSATISGVAGVLLAIGLYTQGAAIIGAAIALKYTIYAKKYHELIPLSRGANALLFVICVSLLITGAGAIAFDLPL